MRCRLYARMNDCCRAGWRSRDMADTGAVQPDDLPVAELLDAEVEELIGLAEQDLYSAQIASLVCR